MEENPEDLTREELIERLEALKPEIQKEFAKYNQFPPNWKPLEKVLPMEHCDGFMYMGYVDGIHMYKHGFTRHYINLDRKGNAYRYVETTNRYVPIHTDVAIEHVFEGLEEMGLTRASVWDHEAMVLRQKAMADAGWTVINVGPDEDKDYD